MCVPLWNLEGYTHFCCGRRGFPFGWGRGVKRDRAKESDKRIQFWKLLKSMLDEEENLWSFIQGNQKI